jgi:beta-galactosidase/beta-glucuronidase
LVPRGVQGSAESRGQRLTLTFEGVNYAAEVWLNGKKLGGFTGAFLRGKFDVTSLIASAEKTRWLCA